MRRLAATFGCDLLDTYADMAALPTATQNSYFLEAAMSGQHLSVAGNAWVAGRQLEEHFPRFVRDQT